MFIKTIFKKVNLTKNYLFVLFVIAQVIALILLVNTFIKSENQKNHIYAPSISEEVFVKNVTLKSSNGTVEDVVLPVSRDSGYSYSYNFVVERDSNDMQQYVNVIGKFSSFILRYKDEIIFHNRPSENAVVSSMAVSNNTVRIPHRLIGKSLEIEFFSNIPHNMPLMIPHILIGTKNQIRKHYFYKDLYKMMAAVALFITALFISIVGLFFIKIGQTSRNLFIAVLFAIIMSLYVFFGTDITLYYLQDFILPYFIDYTCLMIIPIPIYLLCLNIFYENDYYDWRAKSFEFVVAILLINFIIQWVVTLAGISEFILMENVTLLLLGFSSFYSVIVLATIDKNRIEAKRYLVFSALPLAIIIIFSIINYYHYGEGPTVSIIIIFAVYFIIMHFALALKKYVYEYNLAIEDDFYSQLAFYDSLTELPNRHAFESDIQQIASNTVTFSNVYLIMLDMNNLKVINDNYGHNYGDAYLKAAGEILRKTEKLNRDIKAYRHGGDEFMILAYDREKTEIDNIVDQINRLSSQIKISECEYVLDFAIGYSACLDQNTFDAFVIINEADKQMYVSKTAKKGVALNER